MQRWARGDLSKPRLSDPAHRDTDLPYVCAAWRSRGPIKSGARISPYIRCGVDSVYLVAILDWFSRTLWLGNLDHAGHELLPVGIGSGTGEGKPEVSLRSGGTVTSTNSEPSGNAGILISMDGVTRVGHIFTERLWRTVKYEEVYLKDYAGVPDAWEA